MLHTMHEEEYMSDGNFFIEAIEPLKTYELAYAAKSLIAEIQQLNSYESVAVNVKLGNR